MRKAHLKSSGETRTEFFRGRLSPTEIAQVQAALKDNGYASISDLLMAGLGALAILHSAGITVQVGGTITTPSTLTGSPVRVIDVGENPLRDPAGSLESFLND